MADEKEITITHNGENDVFYIKDVNLDRLKEYFGFEVKSLKNCADNRVVFITSGHPNVTAGATYKIASTTQSNATPDYDEDQAETENFDKKWLDENQKTVQNALIASLASYETDAQKYLNSRLNDHNLKSVVQSVNGDCSFIIAESDDKKTVYVAFKETNCWKDLIKDFHIHSKQTQCASSRGRFNSGFLKCADAFPLMTVSEFLVEKNVVVCGHSLGGAISSIVFCHLLSREPFRKLEISAGILNITFGSPLFADLEFRKILNKEIEQMTPRPQMYHFVSKYDPVPRLLCLALSVPLLKEKFYEPLKEMTASENCSGLKKTLAPIINVDLDSDKTRSAKELKNLLETDIEVLRKMYVPIGNYILLNHEESPVLIPSSKSDDVLPYLEIFSTESPVLIPSSKSDDVLPYLEIFSTVELEKIEGHMLKLYEKDCKLNNYALLGDDGDSRSETQKLENFVPKISEGELVCENYDNEKHLKLNLKGSNIASICLENCEFNFGFPYQPYVYKPGDDETILCQVDQLPPNAPEEEAPYKKVKKEPKFHIKIATVFGFCDYTWPTNEIKNIDVQTIMKFSKEATPKQILMKALQRGVALSDMSDEPALENLLIKSIQILSKLTLDETECGQLLDIFKKPNKELQNYLSTETKHQELQRILDKMTQKLQSGLRLEAPRPVLQTLVIAVLAVGGGLAGAYIAGPGLLVLEAADSVLFGGFLGSAGGVFGGFGLSQLLKKDMGNSNYDICLEFIVNEIFQAWSKQNQSPDKLHEVTAFKNRGGLYNLEKALFLMFDPEFGNEIFKDCSLKDVDDSCKDELIKRIKCIIQMHKLRGALATQCFIGVIGPQDAGKSTFLNKMWNCGAETGLLHHTDKTTLYDINEKIKVVDFPGQNSFQEHSKAFSICGSMNNVTVVILPFAGDVSQLVSDELIKVYQALADSSDFRVIVCINKCGNMLKDLVKEEMKLKQKRKDITNPLKVLKDNYLLELNKHFESAGKSERNTFENANVFFTDWELEDQDSRNRFGIVGIEEIKEALKENLIDLGAIKSTNREGLEAAFKKLNDES
ncbi:uncharacterized protein LOC134853174 [Symsagittifera roscoffensis]|uniref:uncharacterized protein LOC134853174 n=1 Tax=Symsagittifera roscoffensis TaxID=84072 RepID=UPI00307C5D1D